MVAVVENSSAQQIKYITDTETSNISFIKIFKMLKDKGVKNCKFFLRLYNTDLQGIDVYSKNLTEKQKIAIKAEIKINPWYFFREVIRVIVPGDNIPYELNLGNLALTYCMLNNINSMIMLPRQHGKTVGSIAVMIYLLEFATNNSDFTIFNKTLDDVKKNLARYNAAKDCLPQWLLEKDKDDVSNKTSYKNASRSNSIDVMSSALNDVDADKKARGLTTPFIWWDEFSFTKFNDVIYEAASPAQSTAAERAEQNGKFYGKHMSTTPNHIDSAEGIVCKEMMDEAAPFIEEIYDMDLASLRGYVGDNSSNDFVYIEYSWRDLGRSDAWYADQCRKLNHNLLKIKREIDLVWTKASDISVFTEEAIAEIVRNQKPICGRLKIPMTNHYITCVEDIDFTKTYLIGSDIAAGLSRDYSTLVIIDPLTVKPVAFFRSNKIELPQFEEIIKKVMIYLLPRSALAIERAAISLQMISNLVSYKNGLLKDRIIYVLSKDETVEKTEVFKAKKKGKSKAPTKSYTKTYGINTTVAVRNTIVEFLLEDVVANPHIYQIKEINDEIANLERGKSGKIEHSSGNHDDLLFGYLMGRYAIGWLESTAQILARGKKTTSSAFSRYAIAAKKEYTNNLAEEFIKSGIGRESSKSSARLHSLMKLIRK